MAVLVSSFWRLVAASLSITGSPPLSTTVRRLMRFTPLTTLPAVLSSLANSAAFCLANSSAFFLYSAFSLMSLAIAPLRSGTLLKKALAERRASWAASE